MRPASRFRRDRAGRRAARRRGLTYGADARSDARRGRPARRVSPDVCPRGLGYTRFRRFNRPTNPGAGHGRSCRLWRLRSIEGDASRAWRARHRDERRGREPQRPRHRERADASRAGRHLARRRPRSRHAGRGDPRRGQGLFGGRRSRARRGDGRRLRRACACGARRATSSTT
jgi:hypothetical protein